MKSQTGLVNSGITSSILTKFLSNVEGLLLMLCVICCDYLWWNYSKLTSVSWACNCRRFALKIDSLPYKRHFSHCKTIARLLMPTHMSIFSGGLNPKTPELIDKKIWCGWLCRRWQPTCQNSKRSPHSERGGVCVKYHPRVDFIFTIFLWLHILLASRD